MPAVATMHPQPHGGVPGTQYQIRHVPSQPLRRAVYIHVSDLISAYNIDHVKLDKELERVKSERDGIENKQLQKNSYHRSSGASTGSGKGSIGSNASASLTSMGGVPTELDAREPQKRLQPPRGGHNMVVLVGNVRIVVDKYRVDGSRVRLAEVEVGDETGIVSLRARDDQIDIAQSVAAREGAVVLRNCTIELYQGKHIRLAVTKWGKLSTYPDHVASTPPPPSKINRDRNFSLIDLSLVASEMSSFSTHSMHQIPDMHQQSMPYHRQHSHASESESYQKQSVQHQQHRDNGRKQNRGKQRNASNPAGNVPPPIHYQVVDSGGSSAGAIRYDHHTLSSPQVTLPTSAFGPQNPQATALNIAHHSSPSQHFPYPPSQRQGGNVIVVAHQQPHHHHHHHQQQMLYQQQFQRPLQHMYHHENSQTRHQPHNTVPQHQYHPPAQGGGVSSLPSGEMRHGSSAAHSGSHPYTPHRRHHHHHRYHQQQTHRPSAAAGGHYQMQPSTQNPNESSPGRMNPAAASFDPSGGTYHRQSSR